MLRPYNACTIFGQFFFQRPPKLDVVILYVEMVAIPAGFTLEEYLAMEQANSIRHEYRQGLVYAMSGGSDDHSRLAINLLTELNLHLRDRDCRFFSGDVKGNYAADFFYYPDAFVTCDPRDREDRYVKRYPKLIAEVLSPATEEFDRGDKFRTTLAWIL